MININREIVEKYYKESFTFDLFNYFEISNWGSDEGQLCVSEETCFDNLHQRKQTASDVNTITPVCYSWKARERDFIFSGIFAYLYIAQKSIFKYSNRDVSTFNKAFSFPNLQDSCPNGYFDAVVALKEATLAPTQLEANAYLAMLDVLVPYMCELTKPYIDAIDTNDGIIRSIDTHIENLRKWVTNTQDELVSFYGVLLRKEYDESRLYDTKYFFINSLVDILQKHKIYSYLELKARPIPNDSPLEKCEFIENPVAHYRDVEFIIDYNNQGKDDLWNLEEESEEEKKQRDLYNILINTLWEDEKFCENGKYGIRDCRGRVIVPAEYDDCLGGLSSAAYISSDEMIIAVKQNGKWGFIKRNTNLEQVVNFKYDLIEDTLHGVYITHIANRYGIIGKRGVEILPTIMEDIYRPSILNGDLMYKQNGKYGFRLHNKSRSTELFDNVDLKRGEFLSVCRNGEWGFIDENGSSWKSFAKPAVSKIFVFYVLHSITCGTRH